jgi:DNA helicase-2/ATP-dependent DNA helicase PcrA
MEQTLSKYQEEIIDTFTKTSKNIVINACPGSGKTFILCELAKKIPLSEKGLFVCFNKSIQEELGKRLPFQMKALTLHSLGMRTLMRHFGCTFTVQEDKTFILCKKIVEYGKISKAQQNQYLSTLCQLVNLYRMNLLSKASDLVEIGSYYDFVVSEGDCENVEKMLKVLQEYNSELKQGSYIDFTDMLWLCKDLPETSFSKWDVVFIDEGQDLNFLQKFLVERSLKSNGRFVFVGDKKQAIYAFMGASLEVFQSFETKPNTVSLPLSVTYRCPSKVTEEANKIFSGMESFESLSEGEVRVGKRSEIEEGDYVICRNNRPLVELWIYLISEGKKANIYGKDFGEQLCKMLSGLELCSVEDINTILDERRTKIIESLIKRGVEKPQFHPKVVKFEEMYSILQLLFNLVDSVELILQKIGEMFTNELNKGVTLLTIHKSKGLENKNIFFLNRGLIPSPYAQSSTMLYAEKCLAYVGVTRAKEKLIYLD